MTELPGTPAKPAGTIEDAPDIEQRIALSPAPRKPPMPAVKAIDDAAPPISPRETVLDIPEIVVTPEPLRQPAAVATPSAWRPGLLPRRQPDYEPDEEEDPGWGETWKAAYQQFNDVVNAVDWARRPTFAEDPDYNLFDDERFAGTVFERDYMDNFIESRSKEETGAIAGRIENEWKRREFLSRAGWPGMLASFSAGAMSPLIFVPLVGWYASAVRGARAASMAVRAGEGAVAGGASVAAYEGVLQGTQETRETSSRFSTLRPERCSADASAAREQSGECLHRHHSARGNRGACR
jgi:hypothetical protein